MTELERQPYWPDLLRQLEERPLAELARRFRTTPGAISAACERTGAWRPRAGDAPSDDLPPEPGEGTLAREEARRALERLRDGSKDPLIARHASMLGKVPDADVAKAAGVSIRTVASFRSRHGIPGYDGPRRKPTPTGLRRSRLDAHTHLLGRVPDHVVAEKAGVTVHAVRAWRARHDVPASPTRDEVVPSRQAWRVAWRSPLGRRTGVIVAGDLDDALVRLQRAGLGEIVGLELLGPVVGG